MENGVALIICQALSEGKNWTTLAMRFRVGFLYKGHDLDKTWWWEMVVFARKLAGASTRPLLSSA